MKRIREFFESIAFAGMKPGGTANSRSRLKWLGPLSGPVERLLSGGPAPSDPLYLTNRSLGQKLRSWSLVAIPCVLLMVAVLAILKGYFGPRETKPAPEPTAAEITAKLLPDIDKEAKLAPPAEVQVAEIQVDGSRVIGTVRNTTTREIALVELVIHLTDASGSQVGAVTGTVEKLPPSGRKEFQIPVKSRNAAFALVREVIVH